MIKPLKQKLLLLTIFFIISLIFILPTSFSAEYLFNIHPNTDDSLDMRIQVINFNPNNDFFLKISHRPQPIPTKFVANFPDIYVNNVTFFKAESIKGGLIFGKEKILATNFSIKQNIKEQENATMIWYDVIIEVPKNYKEEQIKNFLVKINGIKLPGLTGFVKKDFPKDFGIIDIFLKFPEKTYVIIGGDVSETFEINTSSFIFTIFNETEYKEEFICPKQAYTTIKKTPTGTVLAWEYYNFLYEVKKDFPENVYLHMNFLYNRPQIYYRFLQISIVIIYILLVSSLIFGDYAPLLTSIMFLIAVYNLLAPLKLDRTIPTKLEDELLVLIYPFLTFSILIIFRKKIPSLINIFFRRRRCEAIARTTRRRCRHFVIKGERFCRTHLKK